QDYYQTGIFGDFLNNQYFCVSEPGMDLPCTSNASGQSAYAGARSRHPGGINVLLGDGSVRFLKNSINMSVWLGLNTINGCEIISADAWRSARLVTGSGPRPRVGVCVPGHECG